MGAKFRDPGNSHESHEIWHPPKLTRSAVYIFGGPYIVTSSASGSVMLKYIISTQISKGREKRGQEGSRE